MSHTPTNEELNRLAAEVCGRTAVECCQMCEQPKVRTGQAGSEVELGWPACANPDCPCAVSSPVWIVFSSISPTRQIRSSSKKRSLCIILHSTANCKLPVLSAGGGRIDSICLTRESG